MFKSYHYKNYSFSTCMRVRSATVDALAYCNISTQTNKASNYSLFLLDKRVGNLLGTIYGRYQQDRGAPDHREAQSTRLVRNLVRVHGVAKVLLRLIEHDVHQLVITLENSDRCKKTRMRGSNSQRVAVALALRRRRRRRLKTHPGVLQ